jgi:hypothetical protein
VTDQSYRSIVEVRPEHTRVGEASGAFALDLQQLNSQKECLAGASGQNLRMTRDINRSGAMAGVPKLILVAQSITSRTFEYWRVGHDRRRMAFLPGGRVGEGAAGCEVYWRLRIDEGEVMLEILSGTEVTCRMKQDSDESWRGRWTHHEKMGVVLCPLFDADY